MAQKKRQPNRVKRVKMQRVLVSMPVGLVDMIDEAAKKDFTSRSGIMRAALLWYLRPQGRDFGQANPDEILKMLQQRKLKAAIKKSLKED